MFELLVFDWDGTLMDSEARIVACMQAAAVDLGVEAPSDAATREIIGLGLQEAVRGLFPALAADMHERLALRYREHFLVINQSRSKLFAGVEETLTTLHSSGYLLGVATGKSRRGLDRELEETGLGGLFHATRCADETFSKPHPQMLEELMDELGVAASTTLMVGDTEYDMQLASNAGAAALGVTYGVHAPERLMAQGALATVGGIGELIGWLADRSSAVEGKRDGTEG